jgi:nicotinate phosphoribosyltransferase
MGIRLDSGDLAQLSKECRQIMTEVGKRYDFDFSKMSIVASNDINEDRINEFNASGH